MDYMASMIEKITIERRRKVESAILGEIRQIAVENGIETKIIMNENVIVDALKKQIPNPPDYEGDGYDDSGNLIYDTWMCPNCGDRYELDYEIHSYCPVCGQRIDWGGELICQRNVLVKQMLNLVVLAFQCIVTSVTNRCKASLFKGGFAQIVADH